MHFVFHEGEPLNVILLQVKNDLVIRTQNSPIGSEVSLLGQSIKASNEQYLTWHQQLPFSLISWDHPESFLAP
jgi:hypothetical protein